MVALAQVLPVILVTILIEAAACGGSSLAPGGPPPPGPPDGCTADPLGIGFDASAQRPSLPDVFIPAPPPQYGPPPPCAGTHITGQSLSLTAWGTAFPGGVDKRVAACVARGTWSGRLAPGVQTPDGCRPAPGSPYVTVTFSVDYAGDFDRLAPEEPPEACIYRSGIRFGSFAVTGNGRVDGEIRTRVQDDIHGQVDREVADQVNVRLPMEGITSGTNLPDGRSGRCPGWSRSGLPLPTP
jgi:hypothetical protein